MQELAVIEHTGTGVVNFEEYAMSKQGVLKQADIIQVQARDAADEIRKAEHTIANI